jgi:hypothetical protein
MIYQANPSIQRPCESVCLFSKMFVYFNTDDLSSKSIHSATARECLFVLKKCLFISTLMIYQANLSIERPCESVCLFSKMFVYFNTDDLSSKSIHSATARECLFVLKECLFISTLMIYQGNLSIERPCESVCLFSKNVCLF